VRALPLLLLSLACGGDDKDVSVTDTSGETVPTTGTLDTAPEALLPASCAELGLPELPWSDSPGSLTIRQVAADFTLPTRAGDWTLSEQWSGCDTYLFVTTSPRQTEGYPTLLWDRDVKPFLNALPPNVHLFIISELDKKKDVEAELDPIAEDIAKKLENIGEDAVRHWAPRIHYVTKGVFDLDWVGDYLRSPGWGFGIDRFQQIRDVGSFADHERYNAGIGWFEPNLSQLANEAIYYNFEAERAAAMEADGATVVRSFDRQFVDDSGWAGVQGYADLVLPDADTMAGFDTLELDAWTSCGGDAEYGTCPAWDRIVTLYACDEPQVVGNPHADTPCQERIPGVEAADEQLGRCVINGLRTVVECRDDVPCDALDADTGDTAGLPLDTAWMSTGTEPTLDTFCEGYAPEVIGVEEVPADAIACACDKPDGSVKDTAYTCNGDGTGYSDCPCNCDTEVGRWISTYHREGRWVHDVSHALPFFQDGGTKRLAFYTIDPWEITVDFRFKNSGRGMRPVKTVPLWRGGGFDSTYNENRPPIEVDVPASARKVELSVVISGHGQVDPGNCAEFCDTDHQFSVNGSRHDISFPETNSSTDCQDRVNEGVVPNQYGTWFYGRSNWCPGKEVKPIVFDVTSEVTPGETATFAYEAFFNDGDYPAGGASFDLTTWVTVWE
jgi:hypothetical protein